MSSDDVAIRVDGLGKCYQIYAQPRDRLKQFIYPRLQRWAGQAPKNYFREFWALRDVSFEVKKGETVGIVGRNGSGKSTLLQLICGTLSPTTGTIETRGRVAALLELGSGFNPEFTGRENVYLNGTVLGLSREEIDQRFDDIAAFADVGDFLGQPVKTYSSGMAVRLAFSVMAHVDAEILVIDEALSVGDAFFQQRCMRFLRRFREHGTVLFVSHDTAAVVNLCHHARWVDGGRIVAAGGAKEVCEQYLAVQHARQRADVAGESVTTPNATRVVPLAALEGAPADPRLEQFRGTALENRIQVFNFAPENEHRRMGAGKVRIAGCELSDERSVPLRGVVGGEIVSLRIVAEALAEVDAVIIGFYLKDRLGQRLFGDNTFLTTREEPIWMRPGDRQAARFVFRMPVLPVGDYSFDIAVATGTQSDHTQQDWVYDALIVRSQTSSAKSGLLGIPMLSVTLEAGA